MSWQKEEESFKPKEKKPAEIEIEKSKIDEIMDRLNLITKQVNSISEYLSNVSQKVSKAIDASVAYQRDMDDLERRIELIKSKIDELDQIVPEVKLGKKFGKKAA